MNRANQKNKLYDEKIDNLKKIIPEAFQDGKLNVKELESLLSGYIAEDDFNYSFTWHGKQQAKRGAYLPTTLTLKPNKEKSKQFDETKNIYIEGDNLNVLKVLRDTYANKVKMIYIDPPYNTGNDFIYPDNFEQPFEEYKRMIGLIDEEGNKISTESEMLGRKHTNWLNMMYSRLLLARDFLTDDGVVFISIDDNEYGNLIKICCEIFGENNYVGSFIVNSSPSAIDYGHMAKMHEYTVMFVKNWKFAETYQLEEKGKIFKYKDKKGDFNLYPLYNGNVAFNPSTRPNLFYPFYLNPNKKLSDDFYEIDVEEHDGWVKVEPVISRRDGVQRVWRWGKEKAKNNLNDEIVGYINESGEYRIVQKTRLTTKTIRSLLLDTAISSRRGTAEVQELFDKKVFNFPKPVELIRRYVEVATNENSLVLDFFSGSATTAHAVLQQNFEDGGNRKFIMVQLPEPINEKQEAYKEGYRTIAEIGQERIRRAGEKIISDNPLLTTELDVGFKVFELTDTNFPQWNEDVDKKNISSQMELLATSIHDEESAVYEVLLLLKEYLLDESVEMIIPHVYVIGSENKTLVYLHDQLSDETYQWLIKNYHGYSKVIIYDNALNQSQKINLQGTLKEKMETV